MSRSRKQRKNNRGLAPALLIGGGGLLLLLAVIVLLAGGGDSGQTPVQKMDIPLLEGDAIQLADYKGQTVVVNFWASWCPPCRAEMPDLDAYYRQYQDQGLVMVAINSGESVSTAESFIAQSGFTFTVGLDPDNTVSDAMGITALPVTLVISPDGEIVYRHSGMISRSVLETRVTPLLDG